MTWPALDLVGDPPPGTAGLTSETPLQTGRKASSCDEFSPLREVVVGNPANAQIPETRDRSMWLNLFGDLPYGERRQVSTGAFPRRVIEETTEDIIALVTTLETLGIAVHHPETVDHSQTFSTPDWASDGFYSYCPRDLALVVGDMIIETPAAMRARYFELFGLKALFTQYMINGSSWISAPKPRLADELYRRGDDGLITLGEHEPVFDAANILRCGRDLFFQVSSSGNELGRIWLENTLRAYGDFQIHPLRDVYQLTHIDSTISLLRPGLVLLNPERVSEENLPACFRSWDKIWCPDMADSPVSSAHPLSSRWIGMNLLMVSPELAIVDADQTDLIKAMERHGLSVLPHALRHARALSGGFHCVTLDVVRDGGLDDYFS